MDKNEKIVITGLQVEALKLRAKGYSFDRIARELGSHASTVYNALKLFENETWPKLKRAIKEIKKSHYFMHPLREPDIQQKVMRAFLQKIDEKVKQGLFVGSTPPYGYALSENGVLTQKMEEAEIVKRVFNLYKKGMSTLQISREVGLNRAHIQHILRNPVYVGYIRFKGKLYHGKHEPIITKELWEVAQRPKIMAKIGKPPYGFKRAGYRFVADPEGAEKIRRAFHLRLQKKDYAEISRLTGIPRTTLIKLFKRPVYAGKVYINGELVDGPIDKIVDFNVWQRVQNIKIPPGVPGAQKKKEIGLENRRRILLALPGKSSEIAEKMGLKRITVIKWLKKLKEEGLVEKRGGQYGKWYIKEDLVKILRKG